MVDGFSSVPGLTRSCGNHSVKFAVSLGLVAIPGVLQSRTCFMDMFVAAQTRTMNAGGNASLSMRAVLNTGGSLAMSHRDEMAH